MTSIPTVNTLCTRCRSAPPLAPGMTLCRACLTAQVDRDRAERAQRWALRREGAEHQRALRDWQAPIGRPKEDTP